MSKFHWIIDPGHGGIDPNGNYTTAPSKMYAFDDGFIIYEGEFNRLVAKELGRLLMAECIDFSYTVEPEDSTDASLGSRVRKADALHERLGNCMFVSIHGNAGRGKGFEIFTSVGQTLSDRVAEYFYDAFEKEFPESVARTDMSDGDKDKEAQYYVLRKTDCPAILTENFFMDNRKEAEFMMSTEGITRIAKAHLDGIKFVECYINP